MMLPSHTVAEGVKIKAWRLGAVRRSPQRTRDSKHQAVAENSTAAFAGDLAKRRRAVHLSESSLHCGA